MGHGPCVAKPLDAKVVWKAHLIVDLFCDRLDAAGSFVSIDCEVFYPDLKLVSEKVAQRDAFVSSSEHFYLDSWKSDSFKLGLVQVHDAHSLGSDGVFVFGPGPADPSLANL